MFYMALKRNLRCFILFSPSSKEKILLCIDEWMLIFSFPSLINSFLVFSLTLIFLRAFPHLPLSWTCMLPPPLYEKQNTCSVCLALTYFDLFSLTQCYWNIQPSITIHYTSQTCPTAEQHLECRCQAQLAPNRRHLSNCLRHLINVMLTYYEPPPYVRFFRRFFVTLLDNQSTRRWHLNACGCPAKFGLI
jgi:hypothetical protein